MNKSSIFHDDVVNFAEHGFFKAVANGVAAHIELDTTLSLSTSKSFKEQLATFSLPGFQVRLPSCYTLRVFY